MRLVLLGPPAAGKGTQGRRLASQLNLPYLSTGAVLRQAIAEETQLGLLAEPILERGGYLPDELILPVLAEWLKRPENASGWVLDGFPRSLAQAEALDASLKESGQLLDQAILLSASFAFLVERVHDRVECIGCGWTGARSELAKGKACPECGDTVAPRPDDNHENVLSRYNEFIANTAPVIDFYRKADKLISVDATFSRDEVSTAIFTQLSQPLFPA